MQCASSTTICCRRPWACTSSKTRRWDDLALLKPSILSGDKYKTRSWEVLNWSKVRFSAALPTPAPRHPALMPFAESALICSCINAANGESTTVTPLARTAGNWKSMLLPAPVGKHATTSRPRSTSVNTCACIPRKSLNPQTSNITLFKESRLWDL